jgi:hypothetical protein
MAPSKARSFFGNSTARFAVSARRTATRARPSLKVFANEVSSLLPCHEPSGQRGTTHVLMNFPLRVYAFAHAACAGSSVHGSGVQYVPVGSIA